MFSFKSNLTKIVILLNLIATTPLFAAPYLSGQVGLTGMDMLTKYANTIEQDYTGGTGQLAVGYLWDIHEKLKIGIESGFNYYLFESINAYHYKYHYRRYSADILAVLNGRVTDRIELFVKFGPAYANNRITSKTPPRNFTINITNMSNGVVPRASFGTGYNLTKKFNVNLSLNREFYRSNIVGMSSLNLGLNYTY